jgi:hypothetical protein
MQAQEMAAQDRALHLHARSEEFEAALASCFPEAGLVLAETTSKHEVCLAACLLSAEHARVLRAAFAESAPHTGAALLRLQFEALLRAAWVLYAATPNQVAKLSQSLDLEAEQAAKNLPGYLEMLASVAKQAPTGLSAPLSEFNLYSRHALNSFVHTGIHPLRRARDGFPVELALKLITFSNGLLHFAYRMLAALTGSQRRMNAVTRLYVEFKDCLPVVEPPAGSGQCAA